MAVPPNADLPRLCASQDFISLTERVKRELQVSVTPHAKKAPATNGSVIETPTEYSFKFRCQRSNSDFLITAREMLEQFLINHNIHVYPSPTAHTHKRGDSFAESFPHFDSKVLSTAHARTRGMSNSFFILRHFFKGRHIVESADLSRPPPDLGGDRRLRLASSSPDVKALFNAPAYIYNLEQHDDVEPPYVPGPSLDYWTPLPPIVSRSRLDWFLID